MASAGCGLAPGAAVLIASRVVQGVGAALVSPTVLAIVGVLYTGAARARAIGVYGAVMGVAAAGGQLVGGALVDLDIAGLGWRAIFLVNLPVTASALVLARRLVPESRAAERVRALDPVGMGLLCLTLLAVALPLIQGPAEGWPAWTWVSLAAAPAAGAAFVAQQRAARDRDPLCDPVLVRNRALGTGLAVQFAFWCCQAPFYLVLALYLQCGLGLSPTATGAVFAVQALAYLVVSLRAPALTRRRGRVVITVGALVLAAGFAALAACARGPVEALFVPLVLVGVGIGLCLTPLTMTVLAHAGPRRSGVVSGALSTMQQAGNTVGLAVTGAIFFHAAPAGYDRAFALAMVELACLLAGVAAASRLLPDRPAP
ncbi:MFS transporter [Pseudonocardia acaciae]|uniref:MFS transporter n=1 Tax=Pseudonocardia acaciae TaxID=551276 RepID=UPI00068827B0|nr:MFS transporter [Pseudonocardia acaciae]